MSHRLRYLLLSLGLVALLVVPAMSQNHRAAPVPPTMEIVVMDPNADPLGRPAVVQKGSFIPGRSEIDIPETVLVHRFYYSGDRTFQAQFLPGGPCIVVVNHPKCGERVYVPVQMIPGAPRVHYTANSIEYDFGKQGIILRFHTLTGNPKVEYRNCSSPGRHLHDCHVKVSQACKEFADRSGLTSASQHVGSVTKNACADTADAIGAVGKTVMIPVKAIGQFIPGSQLLNPTPEDRARRLREAQIQAGQKAGANLNLTIPSAPLK